MKQKCFHNLGEGRVVRLASGRTLYRLASHPDNPILKPEDLNLIWTENGHRKTGAVFNAGATVFQGNIVLLPRCHQKYRPYFFVHPRTGRKTVGFDNYISEIWPFWSKDGVRFARMGSVTIRGDGSEHRDFCYGIEDIRITPWEETYILIGCGKTGPAFRATNADRIAIYSTRDFHKITYHGMIPGLDSRNAVLFPDPVGGKSHMLLRFYPHIYLVPLEGGLDPIFEPARHSRFWKTLYERRTEFLLLEAGKFPHEQEKIGPGAPPIRTRRGWLLIYHAVGSIDAEICRAYGLKGPISRGYSICAALLDPENPRKVLRRTQTPVYIPSAPFELYGNHCYTVDIPAVVFPVGAFVVDDTLIIYAGAGDKYTVLLGCNVNDLTEYLWQHGQ